LDELKVAVGGVVKQEALKVAVTSDGSALKRTLEEAISRASWSQSSGRSLSRTGGFGRRVSWEVGVVERLPFSSCLPTGSGAGKEGDPLIGGLSSLPAPASRPEPSGEQGQAEERSTVTLWVRNILWA
jgi:hypothetical protein